MVSDRERGTYDPESRITFPCFKDEHEYCHDPDDWCQCECHRERGQREPDEVECLKCHHLREDCRCPNKREPGEGYMRRRTWDHPEREPDEVGRADCACGVPASDCACNEEGYQRGKREERKSWKEMVDALAAIIKRQEKP